MKAFGGLMVVFSGAAIGWICGLNLRKRVRQLGEFNQVFKWLGTEINYAAIPLTEAFERIGQRLKGETGMVINYFTQRLKSAEGLTADEAWQDALAVGREDLALVEEDLGILKDFGRTLGNTDRDHQLKAIGETLERLEAQEDGAKEFAERNERIYRYLGVAVGAMVVLFIY